MIGFILNIPYTVIGLLVGLICIPGENIKWHTESYVIILNVRSFWWAVGYLKGMRAMAIGHTILLGPKLEHNDLQHELVHVRQYDQAPLIYPALYFFELIKKGYRNNRYEKEAYRIAGNIYKEK